MPQPGKPKIAVFSGPMSTIANSQPLVTSNKARLKYGLPPRLNVDGSSMRFDVLRAQRLAAPVTVYVEQFSAHPLERDADELYAAPDGYLDADTELDAADKGLLAPVAAERVYQKLSHRPAKLITPVGCEALVTRAVHPSGGLRLVDEAQIPHRSAGLTLRVLHTNESAGPAQTREVAILGSVIALLVSFIGEELTFRILPEFGQRYRWSDLCSTVMKTAPAMWR